MSTLCISRDQIDLITFVDTDALNLCRTFSSAHFVGRMSHRGELAPAQKTSISVNLAVTQPGSYILEGWQIEAEVGKATSPAWKHINSTTRQRYRQISPEHCIVVVENTA